MSTLIYNALEEFEITITPTNEPGELRVGMTAAPAGRVDPPTWFLGPGLWEDNYAFHLEKTVGVAPEMIPRITGQLVSGSFVKTRVNCFIANLEDMGFRAVPRG